MAAIVASSPRRDAHAPSLLARVKGSLARTGSPPSPEAVGFDRNASSSPTNQPSRRFRFSGRAPTSTSVPDLFSPDGKLEGPTSNGIKGLGSRTKSAGDATGKTRRKKTLRGRFGKTPDAPPPMPSLPPTLSLRLPSEQDTKHDAPTSPPASQSHQPETPAAALANETSASFAAAEKHQDSVTDGERKGAEAIRKARLNAGQTNELFQLCATEIKERGLATLGIFRPFRLSESPSKTARLIQLFLLSIDPDTYSSTFAVHPVRRDLSDDSGLGGISPSSSLAFEVPDAGKELRKELAYANIHDVVNVLKWSLRHLRWDASDFSSAASDPFSWYRDFASVERLALYSPQAFSQYIVGRLPKTTAGLLVSVLDLITTVAPHHVANAMPGSKLCKILGYWLLGRIGAEHPPHSFDEVVQAWTDASTKLEHLFLAFIRDQTAKVHQMPTRLLDLVDKYPQFAPGSDTPSIPAALSGRTQRALRINVRSENIIVSPKRRRVPSETLAAAFKAGITSDPSSSEAELWAKVVSIGNVEGQSAILEDQDDGSAAVVRNTDIEREQHILADEHARILRYISNELQAQRDVEDYGGAGSQAPARPAGLMTSPSLSSLHSPVAAAKSPSSAANGRPTSRGGASVDSQGVPEGSRRRSLSVNDGQPWRKTPNLASLPEDTALLASSPHRPALIDWSSFSEDGFASAAAAPDLRLDSVSIPACSPPSTPNRRPTRRTSLGSLRRKRGGTSPMSWPTDAMAVSRPPPDPIFAVTSITTTVLDESFAMVWMDQTLDGALCASFPPFVLAELREALASQLPAAYPGSAQGSTGGAISWLVIDETIIPPRPPSPPVPEDAASISDRRSILAPSIRSFAANLRKGSLGRMSSILQGRDQSGSKKAPFYDGPPPTSSSAAAAQNTERDSLQADWARQNAVAAASAAGLGAPFGAGAGPESATSPVSAVSVDEEATPRPGQPETMNQRATGTSASDAETRPAVSGAVQGFGIEQHTGADGLAAEKSDEPKTVGAGQAGMDALEAAGLSTNGLLEPNDGASDAASYYTEAAVDADGEETTLAN